MRVIDIKTLQARRLRQAKKHKRVRLGFVAMALSVLVSGYSYITYQRPLPSAEPLVQELQNPVSELPNLAWPSYGQAALGAEKFGILGTSGNHTPAPTASVAKIMTALAVLKRLPIEKDKPIPVITIDAVDVATYDYYAANNGSLVRVEAGEQLTQYQALQALLLPSANNIAETLARWAFGSLDAYKIYANNLASSLGLTQTHIADASGFSAETTSTAHDLVLLGLAALKEPVIAEITSQASATIPVAGVIRNTNTQLGQNGVIGLKTGSTDAAGGCYLFAGTHSYPNGQKVTVVGAVMGAASLGGALRDAAPLLDSAYQGFGNIAVAKAGQKMADYRFDWGATNEALITEDVNIFGWRGAPVTTHVNLEQLEGQTEANSQVGTLSSGTVFEQKVTPVIIKSSTIRPNFSWRLSRF